MRKIVLAAATLSLATAAYAAPGKSGSTGKMTYEKAFQICDAKFRSEPARARHKKTQKCVTNLTGK